ncbi:hypothetical protein ZWY2020_053734 [Hordeum vulgare]|nr:hypothetical protein ZWY2020_053734 [Hordeum vulgare]
MGSGEGPVSPRPTSRRHRRPHGDGADEASSPKRQKRSHHRHHHGHGNGDRGDQEVGSRPRVSAARPVEGEVEEGEIVDDAAAAYRGPDAGFGKAGSVFGGLAPAPGCDDKFDANKKCREANHRRKRSEEIKEESRKEEDQGGFEHFAKQEEDDLKKTKEEARKRMNAILEKHRQRQFQKEHQGPVTSLDRDAATTEIKDANPVAVIVNEKSYTLGKTPIQSNISINLGISGDQRTACVSGFQEGIPMGDRSSDILCDDIFGVSPIRVQKLGNLDGMHVRKNSHRDNWDDEHGYYKYHLGEVLDGHYRITAGSGKGVFSTVVQAKDLKAGENDPEEVAIKIICNDDTKERYKSGKRRFLYWKNCRLDRDDKRHCVRFISSFMYRDHLCLVLESLHMNLREVIKKFGRDIGLKLTAVRAYSKQLFIALKHLKDCSILHCDIKPDNILVNGSKNLLKLCDFGSALPAGINDITPILVSRFYRAPEIILGSIPQEDASKGAFTTQHFDQDLNFHATDENLIKKKGVNKLCMNVKPSGVGPKISSFPGEDPKMLSRFKDLLEKMFVLDPQKRLTVSQALSHPFITGK